MKKKRIRVFDVVMLIEDTYVQLFSETGDFRWEGRTEDVPMIYADKIVQAIKPDIRDGGYDARDVPECLKIRMYDYRK